MIKRKLFKKAMVCIISMLMTSQMLIPAYADQETSYENGIIIEGNGDPESGQEPEVPDSENQDPASGDMDESETGDNQQEESKEVLPVSTSIAVAGDAGNLTLVLSLENASFINENIDDFTRVFSGVPEGVTVQVIAQTENTVTYSIMGNVVSYTKSDLVMVIPGNWLNNTADEPVQEEIPIENHDLFWYARTDFGIRLKSKAETVDNTAFIAQQNLTENPLDYDTIRFAIREMEFKCFADDTEILEYPAEDARVVGNASKDQVLYDIVGIEGGWSYVESGSVRGFVKRDLLIVPNADQKINKYNTAEAVLDACDNKAYDYYPVTGHDYVVKEIPRICLEDLEIKEETDKDSRTVGRIPKDCFVYWLTSAGKDWAYVESGDIRGFVEISYLLSAKESASIIAEKQMEVFPLAETIIDPKENKAFCYRMISTKSGSLEAVARKQIVELAKEYIGNPYVYGGTDPLNGIDCSAFMQFLFGKYGIALPRTSSQQGYVGKMIPLASLDTGDMIIYADDAEIYHVVLYAGDGKTVEAANEMEGVCSKEVNSAAAVWGISLLDSTEVLIMPSEIEKPAYAYETRELQKKKSRRV